MSSLRAAKKPKPGPPKFGSCRALALADGDVGALLAGRGQDAERERLGDGDQQRAGAVAISAAAATSSMPPKKFGYRDHHGGGLVVDGGAQRRRSSVTAAVVGHDHRCGPQAGVSVASTCTYSGCTPPETTTLPPGRAVGGGENHGLGQRRGAVVHRSIAHVEPGELADRRLVLEDGLQRTLAALGLIGRVRRQELGATGESVDDGRHVGVVDAGPQERDQLVGRTVARGKPGQLTQHVGFAGRLGQAEPAGEAHLVGDILEEVIERRDADRGEHLAHVLLGMGNEPQGSHLEARRVAGQRYGIV